jgi:hypothetical protein
MIVGELYVYYYYYYYDCLQRKNQIKILHLWTVFQKRVSLTPYLWNAFLLEDPLHVAANEMMMMMVEIMLHAKAP